MPGPIAAAVAGTAPGDPRRYATYLATRPARAENEAVALLIALCRELRTRTHIVHLVSTEALDSLDVARASGVPITSETCPHYLTFAAEEIPDGATAFKCAPPIRGRENRDRLWNALMDGALRWTAQLADRHTNVVGEVPHARRRQVGEIRGVVAAEVHGVRLPAPLGEEGRKAGPQPRSGEDSVHQQQRRFARTALRLVGLDVDPFRLDVDLVSLDRLDHAR